MEVRQGRFVISSVELTASGEDFAAWEVHCSSKEPEILGYEGNEIHVGYGLDHGWDTTIILPQKYADWRIIAEPSRYTIMIVAWLTKEPEEWETVYEREEA